MSEGYQARTRSDRGAHRYVIALFWVLLFVGGCSVFASVKERQAELHGSYVATIGLECIDVLIASYDLESFRVDEVLVEVHVGNRCPVSVEVALHRLEVTAEWEGDASPVPLVLDDPRREVGVRILRIHVWGAEVLRFLPAQPRSQAPRRVCIRVAAIEPLTEQASDPRGARCFAPRVLEGEPLLEIEDTSLLNIEG